MANFCNYEIHVKGSKNAVYLVYFSMPCLEEKDVLFERGKDNEYELHFRGSCKWSVNFGVSDDYHESLAIDSLSGEKLQDLGESLWGVSLKAKSEVFHCEIQVHYWSEESEFDQFDQYINGKCVKQRKIKYNYETYNDDYDFEDDYNSIDPREAVYSVCHIGEADRNAHIEGLHAGDPVVIKLSHYSNERRGIEAFNRKGETLGYLSFPDDYFMDHIEDFDAEVEEVLPLSEKKKTSKRARIAELAVRLRMKPDKREEYEHELSAKKQEREYGDGEFNWNTLEFNGHEGEYDESVTGEEDDKEFMGRLFGALGMRNTETAEPSDDEQDDDENDEGNGDLESILGRLQDLKDQLETFAEENGINLNDSSIGDTGYDLYKWTFTEGKRAEGKGWSVAIPDGFVKVESKENRIFELIPAGSENLERDSLPITVLPGEQTKSIVNKWMSHPDAQAGWMAAAARMMAEGMSGVMGGGCQIMASGFGDIGAMVLVQDTGGSSYSYLSIVCTDTVQQMLRVQTAYITDEQKNNLDKSVMAWLETFRFTRKNKAVPEYAPFESPDILNNLKKGTVKDLNDATDAAITEYKASFAGPLQALHYMGENGLLDDYTEEKVKDFLIRSTGVYEYYMKKADALAEKAIKEKVSYETQKKMYKKLQELSDIAKDKQTITLEGEEIKTEISADVIAIARKWSKKGEEIEKAIEAEKKTEEEKKKRRTEDEKAEYARKTREVLALRESLLKSSIEEKRRKLKAEADRKYEDAVSSGEQFIQTMNKEKEEAQKELGTLGIFAFSRKNELKTNIKNCDIKIRKRQSVMEAAKEEHTKALSEIEKQIEASKDKEKERIERSNPLPERPASMRLTMDIIYEYMRKNYNVPFTIDDLCEHFKEYGVSTQEMTTLIYRMRDNVLVSREVVRGRAYFTAI